MITIIFAPPRTGKTAFMTYLLNEIAFDHERNRRMRSEVLSMNDGGFNLTPPKHCVSANYNITLRKFGYSARQNRFINPFRLGFANPDVETHFNVPYEAIGITEGQKYLNSRNSANFPDWQSRWYEQHGHLNLDIFIDTQRPHLIDVNVRALANFIEILKMEPVYGKNGWISGIRWRIREIESDSALERYFATGKKDSQYYTEKTVYAPYNVFELYDHQGCKPKFYAGNFERDYDINLSKAPEKTKKGFEKAIRLYDDEKPVKQKEEIA